MLHPLIGSLCIMHSKWCSSSSVHSAIYNYEQLSSYGKSAREGRWCHVSSKMLRLHLVWIWGTVFVQEHSILPLWLCVSPCWGAEIGEEQALQRPSRHESGDAPLHHLTFSFRNTSPWSRSRCFKCCRFKFQLKSFMPQTARIWIRLQKRRMCPVNWEVFGSEGQAAIRRLEDLEEERSGTSIRHGGLPLSGACFFVNGYPCIFCTRFTKLNEIVISNWCPYWEAQSEYSTERGVENIWKPHRRGGHPSSDGNWAIIWGWTSDL